jgi:hypothetical protein
MSVGPKVMAYRTYALRLRALLDQQAAERRDLECVHADELGELADATGWSQALWDSFLDDHAPKYMNETQNDD